MSENEGYLAQYHKQLAEIALRNKVSVIPQEIGTSKLGSIIQLINRLNSINYKEKILLVVPKILVGPTEDALIKAQYGCVVPTGSRHKKMMTLRNTEMHFAIVTPELIRYIHDKTGIDGENMEDGIISRFDRVITGWLTPTKIKAVQPAFLTRKSVTHFINEEVPTKKSDFFIL